MCSIGFVYRFRGFLLCFLVIRLNQILCLQCFSPQLVLVYNMHLYLSKSVNSRNCTSYCEQDFGTFGGEICLLPFRFSALFMVF